VKPSPLLRAVLFPLGVLRWALGVTCAACFTRVYWPRGPVWWCRGELCQGKRVQSDRSQSMKWNGEIQPIDTIRPGDPIPHDPSTTAGGVALLRHLVPTLSEARAKELHDLACAERLPTTTAAFRDFVRRHAPSRV
jgi:hypothetical protein